jgi:hypothetical protein
MAVDPREFAQMLGAKIAGEIPDVGGGPFGMSRLAQILHGCLTPSQGERPGRPTNPNWTNRCKVPMSETTFRNLTELAKQLSTPQRKISPMQVAAQLLEQAADPVGAAKSPDAIQALREETGANEPEAVPNVLSKATNHAQPRKGRRGSGVAKPRVHRKKP